MINLTKEEWEEVKRQNIQLSKQYSVNLMIAECAVKIIDKELKKLEDATQELP